MKLDENYKAELQRLERELEEKSEQQKRDIEEFQGFLLEHKQTKERETEEWSRFLMKLKQKQKEEEENAVTKKREEEKDGYMRERLRNFGYQEDQIEAIFDPVKAAGAPANPVRLANQPTYVKVHREHLAVETLNYYEIPYEVDRVSFHSGSQDSHVINLMQNNPDYIVILQEMDPEDTHILFDHTSRLRQRRGRESSRFLSEHSAVEGSRFEYARVRRRTPSPRRRSLPNRSVGKNKMFY